MSKTKPDRSSDISYTPIQLSQRTNLINTNTNATHQQSSIIAKPLQLIHGIYSTVTLLAKFLGKSTFNPSPTASQ